MAHHLLHMITFRWRPDASPASINVLHEALDRYGRTAPGVRAFACGPDLGMVEGNADYGLAAVFESEAAFHAYRDAQQHRELVTDLLAPLLESRSGAQLPCASPEGWR